MIDSVYIAEISYKIESWLYERKSNSYISNEIMNLQKTGQFPIHLIFIRAFFDHKYSSSGCAFSDKRTGLLTLGFAGTNLNNTWLQTLKDIVTNGCRIGIKGIKPHSRYMQSANTFVDELINDGYKIIQTTGHSLGGALCVIVGIQYNVPIVVTYNAAPLYGLPTAKFRGVAKTFNTIHDQYQGEIIRFVSNNDWVTALGTYINGLYYGEKYTINNNCGHSIVCFKGIYEQKYIDKVLNASLNVVNTYE